MEVDQYVDVAQVAGSESAEAVTTTLSENDVPLAALSRSLRVRSGRKEGFFKLSRKGHPNPVLVSGGDEGG